MKQAGPRWEKPQNTHKNPKLNLDHCSPSTPPHPAPAVCMCLLLMTAYNFFTKLRCDSRQNVTQFGTFTSCLLHIEDAPQTKSLSTIYLTRKILQCGETFSKLM